MEQNEQIRTAWDFVENTGRSIFLTGKAGTGKTTFLKSVVEKSRKRPIVVAPTGVAAINAGGVTIHSFFQLPFSPYVPGAKVESKFDFGKEKRKIIASSDLTSIFYHCGFTHSVFERISSAFISVTQNFSSNICSCFSSHIFWNFLILILLILNYFVDAVCFSSMLIFLFYWIWWTSRFCCFPSVFSVVRHLCV